MATIKVFGIEFTCDDSKLAEVSRSITGTAFDMAGINRDESASIIDGVDLFDELRTGEVENNLLSLIQCHLDDIDRDTETKSIMEEAAWKLTGLIEDFKRDGTLAWRS